MTGLVDSSSCFTGVPLACVDAAALEEKVPVFVDGCFEDPLATPQDVNVALDVLVHHDALELGQLDQAADVRQNLQPQAHAEWLSVEQSRAHKSSITQSTI